MPSAGARLRNLLLVFTCMLAMASVACRHHRVQAAAPPPATTAAPVEIPPAKPEPAAPKAEVKPATSSESAPTPPAPAPAATATKSPRPKPHVTQPTVEPPPAAAPAPKPSAPEIVPSFTPEEELQYRRKTDEIVVAAEKNIQAASSKTLNAAQRDLLEKVRGFLAQSYEARRRGELVRALNLAEKAHVLSVELVNML